MRDHRTIIRGFGVARLKEGLALEGVIVSASTPQRWADRNSVPGEYWQVFNKLGVATLEELASAAAVSPANDATPQSEAA